MSYEILDLCCGLGGWSDGFSEIGDRCTGIDNRNLGYPYHFIHKDIFDFNPAITYDVIVASPPCSEFSTAKYYAYGTQKERQGLDIVQHVQAIITHCRPRYWLMENVKHLADFIGPPQKIVPYNKWPGGKKAFLWGNFPDFDVSIDGHRHDKYGNSDPRRAKIPLELSRALARACHKE